MRLLIILTILTGCTNEAVEIHRKVKFFGEKNQGCYLVTQPEEIKGYYCLQYMGEKK
jgi:hypothetical protein